MASISTTQHWTILGAGAIGCLWADKLLQLGHQVTLLLRDEQRCRDAQAKGVWLKRYQGCKVRLEVGLATVETIGQIDRLLVTTKAFASFAAVSELTEYLADKAPVVLLQNGLGPQQQLIEQYPKLNIWLASTTEGGYRDGPFSVVQAGLGQHHIGRWQQDTGDTTAIYALIEAGMQPQDQMELLLWQKLAINCAINPLTLLHQCRNGGLLQDPAIKRQMRRLCDEIPAVALAEGVDLDAEQLFQRACQVAQDTSDNISSMLQDSQAGRRTEIEQITGYLCQRAEHWGIAAPNNRELLKRLSTTKP